MSACEFLVRRRNEIINARDRNRHVVLDIRAFMGLRFGDEFAKAPERPGLSFALRDRRVENDLLLESRFEHAFDQGPDAFTRLRNGVEFHQDVVRKRRGKARKYPEMLEHGRTKSENSSKPVSRSPHVPKARSTSARAFSGL